MAVEYVSEAFEWRYAFYALAVALILFVLPLIALFVRDDPADAGVPFADAADPHDIDQSRVRSGLTVAQALRTGAFWIIIAVFLLFGMTSYALTGNFVALMLKRGAGTLPQIAMLSSLAGVAMIAGRLVFGWLLDRFPVPIVGAGGVLCAAAALAILLRVETIGIAAVTMSALMGIAMGAETDLLSILVGRYFGERAISRIYAWHNVSFLLGAAMGPPLFATLLGRFASADIPILTLIVLVILSASLLLMLRKPKWSVDLQRQLP